MVGNKLKFIWKILVSNDWIVITANPPQRPFTLFTEPNIEVIYHDHR